MIDEEHKRELAQEYEQEVKEEGMRVWIEDNKESLKDEFIQNQEDDFYAYCVAVYHEVEE